MPQTLQRYTIVAFVLLFFALFGDKAKAQGITPAFCPPEVSTIEFAEERACVEDQSWWQKVFNKETFPTASMHVHTNVPFPYGKQLILPPSGQGINWPYVSIFHNQQGGAIRTVRAGIASQTTPCSSKGIPSDPNATGKITAQDQRLAGAIPFSAAKVNCWRDEVGTRQFRFTTDVSSADALKRQYTSCSCMTQINTAAKLVTKRTRGWYQGGDYVDVILNTPFSVTTLKNGSFPNQLSYKLGSGATMASAYLNADLHHNDLGTVLFEYRTGSSGTFTLPPLPPGDHKLLLVGIERVGTGASAGVMGITFRR